MSSAEKLETFVPVYEDTPETAIGGGALDEGGRHFEEDEPCLQDSTEDRPPARVDLGMSLMRWLAAWRCTRTVSTPCSPWMSTFW